MNKKQVSFDVQFKFKDGRTEVKKVTSDFPRWEVIKLREQYKGQARVDPLDKRYKV